MTLNVNTLRTRHRILPNPRTVTLTPQNPTAAAQTVNNVRQRPWSVAGPGEQPIAFEGSSIAFLLPVENLAGTVPKAGDKLTDDASNDWLINGTDLNLEECVYNCMCYDWKGTT